MKSVMQHRIDRAADERCEGCDQPAHEVGPLTPVRITFRRTGIKTVIRYCRACLDIAQASVLAPGASFGAVGLHTEFAMLEQAATFEDTMDARAVLDDFDSFGARVLAESNEPTPPRAAATILDLAPITDPRATLGEIVAIVRGIESLGMRIAVRPHRDRRGIVDGVTIGQWVA